MEYWGIKMLMKNSTLKNIITLGNNQVQKVMVRKADVSQYFREH